VTCAANPLLTDVFFFVRCGEDLVHVSPIEWDGYLGDHSRRGGLLFQWGKVERDELVVSFHDGRTQRNSHHTPARFLFTLSHARHEICRLIEDDGDSRIGANDRAKKD
jgi:hypothetical protein